MSDKRQLQGRKVYVSLSVRIQSVVVGKAEGQECGAAGHIASADKNQREDRGRLENVQASL